MNVLEGYKVVELASFVAVPAAARIMCDWGAQVIKIEAASGDGSRLHGRDNRLPIEDDCNPNYSVHNSGKRMISLDLKTKAGMEAMHRLLADADVFMSNVRWESIKKMGLDYETLHKKFPRLIYMHFTGYGYEGPDKDRPGFDSTAFWSSSGALHEFHYANTPPKSPAPGFGDVASSGNVLSGVLGALLHRERTGEGLQVTTSLYASGIWCNYSRVVGRQEREDGSTPPGFPAGPESTKNPLVHLYECSDGEWILFSGGKMYERMYKACMEGFGLEEYVEDERFSTRTELIKGDNALVLYNMIAEKFKTKTAAEWSEIFTRIDAAHQIVNRSGDVSKDEQALINNYVAPMTCPDGRTYMVPNSPVTFFGIERTQSVPVGPIGCDTEEVLKEYGYTDAQVEEMLDSGAAYVKNRPAK